jgi:hypothetical protein
MRAAILSCRVARTVAALTVATFGICAIAQTQDKLGVPARGTGTMGVSVQHITITERDLTIVRQEFGEITLRAAYFELDYGLTDRLALDVTLPYKSNRYVGDQPHDPRLLLDDHGEEFLDDGQYHSNWGDFGVNLRWLWRSDPIAVTPFVGYYRPASNYPLFTETQAGTGQWRVDVGVNVGGRLGQPTRNLFWQAGFAYSYMEKTYPSDAPARRVNHSLISAEIDWMATPRITAFLALTRLTPHNALEFVDFLPGIFTSDLFYYHDRLLPWEYTTWAAGMSYEASEQLSLSLSYGRTQSISFGHLYEPAVTLGISRSFATKRSGAF